MWTTTINGLGFEYIFNTDNIVAIRKEGDNELRFRCSDETLDIPYVSTKIRDIEFERIKSLLLSSSFDNLNSGGAK